MLIENLQNANHSLPVFKIPWGGGGGQFINAVAGPREGLKQWTPQQYFFAASDQYFFKKTKDFLVL